MTIGSAAGMSLAWKPRVNSEPFGYVPGQFVADLLGSYLGPTSLDPGLIIFGLGILPRAHREIPRNPARELDEKRSPGSRRLLCLRHHPHLRRKLGD